MYLTVYTLLPRQECQGIGQRQPNGGEEITHPHLCNDRYETDAWVLDDCANEKQRRGASSTEGARDYYTLF